MLSIGDKVPLFQAKLQDGSIIQSADWSDKKVILYFYPQDNTPTCTEQACNLRDHYVQLVSKGYLLFGVSPDSEKKHQNFIRKFQLPFDLISDKSLELIHLFGVWGPKKLFGREYDGVLRTTFIIEYGIITKVIADVYAKGHALQIL